MINSNIKIPNNQERASSLYTPVQPNKKSQICLNCPMPKCKSNRCNRYVNELKKLREEEMKSESN